MATFKALRNSACNVLLVGKQIILESDPATGKCENFQLSPSHVKQSRRWWSSESCRIRPYKGSHLWNGSGQLL
ncbi:hypothetical protein Y1Q_0010756 [Alligator mississippiensis]|uniref:Uncharacterized protein n=1 Tax=Alligator mississippiensis TaxID=8496 RepID=A0A151M6U6_ALLMI|nr:hypothetical protein Y1Q_0010756 [Alligator mississippiensis]